MILDPSECVTVRSGSMLELECTIPGYFLEWSFVTREANGQRVSWARILSIFSEISTLQINLTSFTFSRISAPGSLPLMSRLLIIPTYTGLNGTEFRCVDVGTLEASTTFVYVTNEDSVHDPCSFWNQCPPLNSRYCLNQTFIAHALL